MARLVIAIWLSAISSNAPPWYVTVASEKDDQMSETMIKNRNLPNPHLFEPFFYTRACHHPSPYYYLIFKAMGKPT
jgi:hypothetical protein